MTGLDVGRDSIQRRIIRGFFATTGLALVPLRGSPIQKYFRQK